MKSILLLNGKKDFGHSKGELNTYLCDIAQTYLKNEGFEVIRTTIDAGYEVEEEIEKWLSSDVVIYQMPAWWMGPPWVVKKYMDEVFTSGHGRLYQNDGRTRGDLHKKYGSGGLLQGKQYMLSVTWNAPEDAFNDEMQIFQGVGVDGVYLPTHKAHQFLGMSPLPTFMCNDVIKAPEIEQYAHNYRQHLSQSFGVRACIR
jgi:modulator of drug activity B